MVSHSIKLVPYIFLATSVVNYRSHLFYFWQRAFLTFGVLVIYLVARMRDCFGVEYALVRMPGNGLCGYSSLAYALTGERRCLLYTSPSPRDS